MDLKCPGYSNLRKRNLCLRKYFNPTEKIKYFFKNIPKSKCMWVSTPPKYPSTAHCGLITEVFETSQSGRLLYTLGRAGKQNHPKKNCQP